MSLPFIPPPQHLAVDDVLAVEVIGDADAGFQDAREHLGVEHRVGTDAGKHRVITVPIAAAILRATGESLTGEGAFSVVVSHGFDADPVWKWGSAGFRFEVRRPWYGVESSYRKRDGSGSNRSFGWRRSQVAVTQDVGYVVHPFASRDALALVTHVFIAVYGDA